MRSPRTFEGSETIMADAAQIHQVIMNLCTNAAHAMREKGGVLEVKLDTVTLDEDALVGLEGLKAGRYQRLTVRDTRPWHGPKKPGTHIRSVLHHQG